MYPRLNEWETPATKYPLRKAGAAEIVRTSYEVGTYECYGTGPGRESHRLYYVDSPIPVTALQIDGKTWMVDDPPHWWAMQEHACHYRGEVLCAGLGLGLIVHTLQRNRLVRHITVVEREKDVINLVAPLLSPDRVTVIHDDWWEYQHPVCPSGVFYDLIVGNGWEEFPHALRAMFTMKESYPNANTYRVHGYPSEALESQFSGM
jgi:hypothetical protein